MVFLDSSTSPDSDPDMIPTPGTISLTPSVQKQTPMECIASLFEETKTPKPLAKSRSSQASLCKPGSSKVQTHSNQSMEVNTLTKPGPSTPKVESSGSPELTIGDLLELMCTRKPTRLSVFVPVSRSSKLLIPKTNVNH